jgi:4-amino-4-deoxy-L-arabinose transferase-like glycosyltransferase
MMKGPFSYWPFIALLVVFCTLAGSFSLLLPLGEMPDEGSHFDLVRFIAEQGRFPMTQQERSALGNKGDASPIYHGLVAVLSQHVDITRLPRRNFVSYDKQPIPYDTVLTTQRLHTDDEAFPFRGIVLAWHLARLVSIPLSALTIVAVYLTALTIYPDRRYFALAVAGFVAFVPRFVLNSAVVTDDNLVIPLVAFAIYYLVRIIHGDERPRTFVMLGMLSGVAAITKYHAVGLLPEITLVFAALAWRNRTLWKQWLSHWGWVMLSFAVSAGWWFFFLFSHFNRVAELGLVGGLLAPLGDPTTTEMAHLPLKSLVVSWDWVAPVFRSFWLVAGSFGIWAPEPIYQLLALLAVIAAVGLVLAGYRRFASRQPGVWRVDIALLGLHLLLYLGIIFGRYQVFLARGVAPPPYSTQGRYLYPALISIAFFCVLGWRAMLAASLGCLENRFVGQARGLPSRRRAAGPTYGWLAWLKAAKARSLVDPGMATIVNFGLLSLSVGCFFLIVLPAYVPQLPIVALKPDEVAIAHRANATFAKGIDFVGYNLGTVEDSSSLPIDLYWRAGSRQSRDFIAQVCLHDHDGTILACQSGHPADGLYPTRAWDIGYLVRDRRILPLPACLTAGTYELTLVVQPLRNDTASTVVDESEPMPEPLSLGLVSLTPPAETQRDVHFCTASGCADEGQIKLPYLRAALTVVSYGNEVSQPAGAETTRFICSSAGVDSPAQWLPFGAEGVYRCSDGQAALTYDFIADQSVIPGRYTLAINGQVVGPASVDVATRPRNFTSRPAPQTDLGILYADQFTLLGYDADLSPRQPGDSIEVITYWQTRQQMARNYNVALHLLDNTQTTQLLIDQTLGGLYPAVLWAPGEFTQDSLTLRSRPSLLPGLYTLELRVYDYARGNYIPLLMRDSATQQPIKGQLVLGRVRVVDPAESQSPQSAKIVHLGQAIQLSGYDLPDRRACPGQSLSLALHWEAGAAPPGDYTVFTQLIGPDGLVWGQQDNQPQQGRYPTTAWSVGDRVVDRYIIPVRQDAPPGVYRLVVGMYSLATGERLPAIDEQGQRLPDDAITLSDVEVACQP